jgi:hypothetical protein
MRREGFIPRMSCCPCAQVGTHQRDGVDRPRPTPICSERSNVRAEVHWAAGAGQCDVCAESKHIVGRGCTNPTAGRGGRSGNLAQCRDIAAAADPQGPLVETAGAIQGKGQDGVSLGRPGEPRLEVRCSLVLDLSVEGKGDVPLFGERPGKDLVPMRSCSGVEVGDNVVRQYDSGEKPHRRRPRVHSAPLTWTVRHLQKRRCPTD